jgi:eukaryotic-like serine/threonine-protein kinase
LRGDEGPAQPVHDPVRIGELVGGKYRISRFLAQGGMGVVYEAQHEIVRRRFAVKFLRPDFARRREFLGRFQREAEAAGALENEHIASAVDFGIAADGSPFIVMEYLVGENLASLLDREGRLPRQRAADLCMQACQGADAAHTAGIVHRDLKPKNLFVGRREDGTDLLKILDFGIAKLAPVRYDHTTTDTGTVIGTPAYMSPEQARGERALDPRSDVYALGTILFEMLSGQLPHPGDSPNAILHHISTQPSISLAAVVPDLPSALIEAVESALAAAPCDRPQSAGAFALRLAPFARREVWPDRPWQAPLTQEVGEGAPPRADSSLLSVAASRAGRTWRGAALAAAAVLIVAVGAAAISRKPPVGSVDAPLAPKAEVPIGAGPLPPAATAPLPVAPPSGAPLAVPASISLESSRRPLPKPSAPRRPLSSGDVSGRPGERRAWSSTPNVPAGSIPEPVPQLAVQPTRGSMPTATFDPANPYASP